MIKKIVEGSFNNRKKLLNIIFQLKRPPVFVFSIILFIVLFGPWLAPYDPLEPKPMNTLAAPSWEHWFGTRSCVTIGPLPWRSGVGSGTP